jgi:hypothetical protein
MLDASIRVRPEILEFLRQDQAATCPIDQTLARLDQLAAHLAQPAPAASLPARKTKP